MRKIILLFMLFLNIYTLTTFAMSARSAVLIDSVSGRVLYEHNAYEKMPMASTTKIMTGLLACESGLLNKAVKVSPFASGTEGSSLWLKIGEKQTLEDLTYGLMIKSGNDAAVAIAEYLGGSVDAFALLMNKRARAIGTVNTNFENPHGLDSDGHYTTAYDLALIAREAMKNDSFRKIVATKTYSIPMDGENWDRELKNHNKLLWQYDGCIGIKTGYTKKCGRCLVTSAVRDGRELICVTLNAPDDWKDHTELLNYGFTNYKTEIIAKKHKEACEYAVENATEETMKLLYADDFITSKQDGDTIKTEIIYNEINLPLKKGEVAGVMNIWCNEEKIGEIELVADRNLEKLSFFKKFINKLKNSDLFGFWFGN